MLELRDFEAIYAADNLVPVSEVVKLLGMEVHSLPCQVRCPVHRGGQEGKPSARIYQEDKTVWCFTCGVQYTPSQIISERNGLSREEAAIFLLTEFPQDDKDLKRCRVAATQPPAPEPTTALLEALERKLMNYRGRANFQVFRQWALKVDRFLEHYQDADPLAKRIMLQTFVKAMDEALSEK